MAAPLPLAGVSRERWVAHGAGVKGVQGGGMGSCRSCLGQRWRSDDEGDFGSVHSGTVAKN